MDNIAPYLSLTNQQSCPPKELIGNSYYGIQWKMWQIGSWIQWSRDNILPRSTQSMTLGDMDGTT